MFDIAWGEFAVIAVVALIVIGPKELPAVLRAIGQWTAKVRRMAAEFQGQFQEALREAEMADLKKEVDNLNAQAQGFASQFSDPVNAIQDAAKWDPTASAPQAAAKADDGAAGDAAAVLSSPSAAADVAEPAVATAAPAASEQPAPAVSEQPAAAADAPPAASPAAPSPVPGETGVKAEGDVHP